MIQLAMDADGFDLALEIICTIPPFPAWVPLRDLCDDFGFSYIKTIRQLLEPYRTKGVHLHQVPDVGGVVSIHDRRWSDVAMRCEEYLRRGAVAACRAHAPEVAGSTPAAASFL